MNNPYMKILGKKYADTGPHTHETVIGLSRTGDKRSHESAEFPLLMARAYASATRSAWLHEAKPTPQARQLSTIMLSQLMANIALEPPNPGGAAASKVFAQ